MAAAAAYPQRKRKGFGCRWKRNRRDRSLQRAGACGRYRAASAVRQGVPRRAGRGMSAKAPRPDPLLDPATLAARGLGWIDPASRGVVPAIHLATTFEREPDQSLPGGRAYIRPRAPAFDQPEALLAALEGGAGAMLFASGMAAAVAPYQALKPGDHVVAPTEIY